ncbi:MAG: RNA methyltransferase [Flavobacteriales bacterium]|jgi:TrmH family RNA methyltransferase|tara:strand:+ start:11934 stop:12638 length:705 start_codon:yes stop_codon:yes gene_type:complete
MLTNQKIKFIRSLSLKKNRIENQLFVVEGEKNVNEFINSDFVIDSVYSIDDSFKDSFKVSPKELDRISHLNSSNKVLAVVKMPNYDFAKYGNTVIALDTIQDPGNLGTIIRLCDWFGVKEILCSETCVDQYNSKVVQASMGSLSRVKLNYCDLQTELSLMKDYSIISMDMDGVDIKESFDVDKKVIVLGNEGNGISKEVLQLSNITMSINKSNNSKAESLNVANACAIALYRFF